MIGFTLRADLCSLIRQGECYQGVSVSLAEIAAAACRDNDELPAALPAQKSDRSGMPACVELGRPEFFPRLGVEGPETAVVCAADKNQAAGRHDRPPEVGRASRRRPFRHELIHLAERSAPGDFSRVQIDGVERAPGRLLAGVLVLIPEAGILAPRTRSPVSGLRACRLRLHRADGAKLVHVDVEIARLWIEGRARPCRPTERAGEPERQFQPGRSVQAAAYNLVEQLSAIFLRLRCDLAEFFAGEGLMARQRRRLEGYRLSRPGRLGGDFTLRRAAFFGRTEGLTCTPVQHEDQAHLRHLRYGRNRAAVVTNCDQIRMSWQVIIPNVMAHHLVMPDELASRRI